jgi:alkylation response protein AidB-like acyl-CoA dehydrogenase
LRHAPIWSVNTTLQMGYHPYHRRDRIPRHNTRPARPAGAADMEQPSNDNPVRRAHALDQQIAAASGEIERTRLIGEPLLTALHDSRLFRLLLPRSVGGEQVEPGVYFQAVEAVSRQDASVGWNMFVANSSALIAPFLEPQAAREIFTNPRTIVAWGPPNACEAQSVPGGYKVSGRWDFASGCRQANWMGAHVHVREPDGKLRLNRFDRPTIRTLLMPVGSTTILDTWNTIGMRGTGSHGYTIDDVFVPEAFSTTREDPTLRREPGPLYAFTMQGLYAVGVAGVAIGIARAMLSAFVELAQNKTPRGQRLLSQSATIRADVARCEAQIGSAQAYLLETLADIYAQADDVEPIGIPERGRVRLVCANAIHGAIEVADWVYKAAGVSAIFPGDANPFERRFRDIHTLSQQIQSRTRLFEAVGQILVGDEPEGVM